MPDKPLLQPERESKSAPKINVIISTLKAAA
jgi:hypothetical protein